MKHARDDYDRIQDPAGKIPADEPVFLLRAQDELACKAVAYYASLCEQAQAPEVAAKARAHADRMAAWPKKKVPDLAPAQTSEQVEHAAVDPVSSDTHQAAPCAPGTQLQKQAARLLAQLAENRPRRAIDLDAVRWLLELIATPAAVVKLIDELTRTAWEWGVSCEIDGVRWGEAGDSHNQMWRDRTAEAAARLHAAALSAPRTPLAVWYGPMPESNGKSNYTAILHRGDLAEGHTIDRSEYPDRVRYAADCVRHLIGELKEAPDILAYDDKLHSGYVAP